VIKTIDAAILVKFLGCSRERPDFLSFLNEAGVPVAKLPNAKRAERVALTAKARTLKDKDFGITFGFAQRAEHEKDDVTIAGSGSLVFSDIFFEKPAPDFPQEAKVISYPFGLKLQGSRELLHQKFGAPIYFDSSGNHIFIEQFIHKNFVLDFKYDTQHRYEGFEISLKPLTP
jgi:hypothetical protein